MNEGRCVVARGGKYAYLTLIGDACPVTADVPRRWNPLDHGDRDCRGRHLIVFDPKLILALGVEFGVKQVAAARLDGGTFLKGGPHAARLALENEFGVDRHPLGPPGKGDLLVRPDSGGVRMDGDLCGGGVSMYYSECQSREDQDRENHE